MKKGKERLKGALFGASFVVVLMIPVLLLARTWSSDDDYEPATEPLTMASAEQDLEAIIQEQLAQALQAIQQATDVGTTEPATQAPTTMPHATTAADTVPPVVSETVATEPTTQAPTTTTPHVAHEPTTTAPQSTTAQSSGSQNQGISLDEAISIAYAHLSNQSINATFRSHSGIHWERGQWVWELLFRTQGERMPFIEFYINTDNGDIVKMEWDD